MAQFEITLPEKLYRQKKIHEKKCRLQQMEDIDHRLLPQEQFQNQIQP